MIEIWNPATWLYLRIRRFSIFWIVTNMQSYFPRPVSINCMGHYRLRQGPLKIWTEHSNFPLQCRGDSKLHDQTDISTYAFRNRSLFCINYFSLPSNFQAFFFVIVPWDRNKSWIWDYGLVLIRNDNFMNSC